MRRVYTAYGLIHLSYERQAELKEAAAQRALDDIEELEQALKRQHIDPVDPNRIRKEIISLRKKAGWLKHEATELRKKDPLNDDDYASAFNPNHETA